MSYEGRLGELGITLPGPFAPHAPLVGCVRYDGTVRTSGALPRDAEGTIATPGILGGGVATAAGVESARLAALNALSLVRDAVGSLDVVRQVLTMTVFVACTADFGEIPDVADGASRVLVDIFGDAGRHTRSAIGVASLPRHAPVEVELTVAVRESR